MSAYIWAAHGSEWALGEKVSFNGVTKHITVNSDVTALDIATDVYSAWVRWTARERGFTPAMRYSGYDPIPGGYTGATFFLRNGWKLVYDPAKVAVNGVLYSDSYATAYWSEAGDPLYPATVASLVHSRETGGGSGLTASQVWSHPDRELTAYPDVWAEASATELLDRMSVVMALLKNKTVTNPSNGLMTVYEDDGITPLFTAQLYEKADGSQTYRGQGAERREALQ